MANKVFGITELLENPHATPDEGPPLRAEALFLPPGSAADAPLEAIRSSKRLCGKMYFNSLARRCDLAGFTGSFPEEGVALNPVLCNYTTVLHPLVEGHASGFVVSSQALGATEENASCRRMCITQQPIDLDVEWFPVEGEGTEGLRVTTAGKPMNAGQRFAHLVASPAWIGERIEDWRELRAVMPHYSEHQTTGADEVMSCCRSGYGELAGVSYVWIWEDGTRKRVRK